MTDRVLTGMRPTGKLHLGHYVGALKLWLQAQEDGLDCYFLLADIQALSTHSDQPELIKQSVYDVVLDWISVGLNPNLPNVHFVLQSQVLARSQIFELLSMVANYQEVIRNPTIKAEMKQLTDERKTITLGFVSYGVNQAADIEMVSPPNHRGNRLYVPVGQDQLPHLEGTNDIVRAFNRAYQTDALLQCEGRVGDIGRLVGIDGVAKMSKSLGNAIMLSDSPDEVRKAVRRMFTDPRRIRSTDTVDSVEENPLFIYLRAFCPDRAEVDEHERKYKAGQIGDVLLKDRLSEIINEMLDPMRERRLDAQREPLGDYVRQGTYVASQIADEVLARMQEAMHLGFPK